MESKPVELHLYYGVLSDYEIDVIKELATPRVNLMAYDFSGDFVFYKHLKSQLYKIIYSTNFSFQFKRATVQNYKSGNLETASYRISKTAWLRRDEDDAIERIYRRVGDLTGLSMETSEELQVSNYGIGGHYEPHFDFARV